MRTVSLRLADLERSTIPIGFQDENLHTQVRIDCKMIFKDYPAAVVSLAVTPPQGDPYPVMVIRDGDIVAWNVTASDTAYHGEGRVQFTFVDGEEVIKTVRGKTNIAESDVPSGTAPPPIQNWITIANVVLDEVAHAIEAELHAPIIDDNGYWAVWDADAEEYVATEYKAQGTDGHDGVGIVSIEKTGTSGLVDTYTITFTSGNPVTYTVTNGRDADPAALIDDTAGSGATGKTWSADKIAAENLSLKTEINSKMDEPETEGTAGQFLQTDGNGGRTWATPSGGGGTSDYSDLTNKPQINGVTLSGNKTSADLGIGVVETVSGSTPSITGVADHRYICGEVATLSITAPASGCIDVVFESGSTPTVLTVSSAKTGVSAIKWANGFDPTALEANTTYEINILDGEFGVVGLWT